MVEYIGLKVAKTTEFRANHLEINIVCSKQLNRNNRNLLQKKQTLKNLSLSQVQSLARVLAKNFRGKSVIIGLTGKLGAGKTTFAKSFAKTLGIKKVKSPTFTLVSQYPLKNSVLYHMDLYRLGHLDQLQELGLSDLLLQSSRIVLIEWIDKFPKLKKLCDINIKLILTGKNTRNVEITGI